MQRINAPRRLKLKEEKTFCPQRHKSKNWEKCQSYKLYFKVKNKVGKLRWATKCKYLTKVRPNVVNLNAKESWLSVPKMLPEQWRLRSISVVKLQKCMRFLLLMTYNCLEVQKKTRFIYALSNIRRLGTKNFLL
jgi:hypothetical protein